MKKNEIKNSLNISGQALFVAPAHVSALVLRMGVEDMERGVAILVRDPHPAPGHQFLVIAIPIMEKYIFGSDRSSSSHNLRVSVRSVQTCLEQSIFIFLGQRSIRALREQSESTHSTQVALREH